MQLFVKFEDEKIEEIIISGDFSINPPFILPIIQKQLIGVEAQKLPLLSALYDVFKKHKIDIPGICTEGLANFIVDSYKRLRKRITQIQ